MDEAEREADERERVGGGRGRTRMVEVLIGGQDKVSHGHSGDTQAKA